MRSFKMREWTAVGVALAGAGVLFFGDNIWQFITGGNIPNPAGEVAAPITGGFSNTAADTAEKQKEQMTNIGTTAGLEIYDEKVGAGAEAVAGKTVVAHYVGTLADGTKFDSSLDRGSAFEFKLGAGQVIKGWDLGIAGMRVGGVRKLVISPELAYGQQAIGPIPANSTLTFEVQLVGLK
ncbi:MAG: FKBP-type peptidyl-prolyl cis-trans isomerase [Patescibacteria group bacterium]